MCGLGVGKDGLDSHGELLGRVADQAVETHIYLATNPLEMVSFYVAGEAGGWMNGN
jgi:hypothetical protein